MSLCEVKSLVVGPNVLICNIQSQPQLNGRSGTTQKASGKQKVEIGDRIPVLVDGTKKPISLKFSCIELVSKKKPYRTLKELQNSEELDSEYINTQAEEKVADFEP
ncbi:hypothetical protein ACHAW5_004179 [Stephanodiscus triporus]|uniref:Uncharacterized protein n=1 Tax=Stephanodiscus triporus TaxID=2934178 RepID=A0ABD3MU55_9STRA